MAGTVKKLQFSEGTDVGAPTDLGIATSTSVLKAYADDAAYVTGSGAAIEGSVYLNTTLEKFRMYLGGAWRNAVPESNASDATKTFIVDTDGNTTAVSSTLDFNDTANAVHTVPAGTNTLLTRDSTDTGANALTNKDLSDSTTAIVDNSDTSKKVRFECSGITTATTRTMTVPDANFNIVGHDTAQVITNKDIDGGSATNAKRITVPKETTTNLNALTRKEGTVVYDTTTLELKYDNGSSLVALGAASLTDWADLTNNLALAASVGSSALTIALKTKGGSDPSGGSPVMIGFRDATSATGTYNVRSVTAALSITVTSGATLGHVSAKMGYIYIYTIDNSGTVEFAVSSSRYDTGTIVSTTVMSSSSDSISAIYSTTARSNVPLRLIGRALSTQTTAGTWAAVPTELTVGDSYPVQPVRNYSYSYGSGGGTGRGSTATNVKFFGGTVTEGNAISTAGDSVNGHVYTINEAGLYHMHWSDRNSSAIDMYITKNTTGTGSDSNNSLAKTTAPATAYGALSATEWLNAGDVIRAASDAAGNFIASDTARFSITKVG